MDPSPEDPTITQPGLPGSAKAGCGPSLPTETATDEFINTPLTRGAGSERFQIIRRLGEGGMAVVYEAIDTKLGEKRALKFSKSGHARSIPPEAHIPYKGAGDSTMAVVSGQVQLLMTAPGAAIPFIKAGRLRPLAVGSAKRVKALPEVPTMAEAALPGYEVDGFYGVLAPGKTPRPVVDRLYAEFDRILKLPDVIQQLEAQGFDPVSYTPEKFTEHVKKEMQKWPPVFKAAGIKVNN